MERSDLLVILLTQVVPAILAVVVGLLVVVVVVLPVYGTLRLNLEVMELFIPTEHRVILVIPEVIITVVLMVLAVLAVI
jgi:hypothetical protein